MQHTDACDDCVVTFICGREPGRAVVIGVAEARACASSRRPGWCPTSATPAAPGEGPRMEAWGRDLGRRTSTSCERWGSAAGLDAVGVASAEPVRRRPPGPEERKAAGLHGGMHFTYRNPARGHRPVAGRCRGARRWSSAPGPTARRDPPRRPTGDGPGRGWPATPGTTTTRRCATRCGQVAGAPRGRRLAARVLADDNAPGRPRGRLPGRAGLVRQEHQPAAARTRARGSCSGSVVTDAPLPGDAAAPMADGAERARRCLPACPTGALVAPGVLDARRCLAWLVQAPGPSRVEHRGALGDRLYGCDDCQEVCPPNRLADRRDAAAAGGRRTTSRGCRCSSCCRARRRRAAARFGRWYIPRREPRYLRRNALVVLGNIGDGRDPAVVAALRRALADRDPMCGRTPCGPRARLGRADLLDDARGRAHDPPVLAEPGAGSARCRPSVTHLLVTNDFPPKVGGIQSYLWELWRRLPPSEFAVLTSRTRRDARSTRDQPFRVERTRERVLLPDARRSPAASTGWPPRSTPTSSLLDPRAAARPRRAAARAAVRRGRARRRGHRARPLARYRGAARRACCAAPATWSPPVGYPAAEADGRRGRDAAAHGRAARRRRRPLPAARRGARAARARPVRPAARRAARGRRQPPRAAQGHSTCSSTQPHGSWSPDRPASIVAIAGAGRDRGRLERLVDERQAPVRFLGRVPDDDLPALYALRRRVRHAVPRPVGAGSSRRGSASCSSRPPRAACRRWRATAAARPRPWSTV